MEFTKEEFLGYVMLWAANADVNVTQKEKKEICAKTGLDNYEKVLEQFYEDSDLERLQTIVEKKKLFFPDDNGTEELLQQIRNIFFLDRKLSAYEQQFLNSIKRILK